MEKRLVKIGEASKILGTTPDTLRKWEATGEIVPTKKTKGGTRYYDVAELLELDSGDYPTIGYARVSSEEGDKLFEETQNAKFQNRTKAE